MPIQNKINYRNKTIDIFRALALLLVIAYHFYALRQLPLFGNQYIDKFIHYGGEIGVTLFFIISGYGIFISIDRMVKNGGFSFITFLKKRFTKIAPQYYFCIFITIIIGSGIIFLSKRGFVDIFAHLFFVHNLTHITHGTINGSLWTMGTIVQFYAVSYIMYKLLKKFNVKFLFFILAFVVVAKYLFFHFIFAELTDNAIYYFVYGRQLIFCIDNFVLGMFLAKWYNTKASTLKKNNFNIIGLVLSIVILYGWLLVSDELSVYGPSLFQTSWHTILAVLLVSIMYFSSGLLLSFKTGGAKCLFIISKYEYGIYLWHLLILSGLLNSDWFKNLSSFSMMLSFFLLLLICLIFGYFSTMFCNGIKWNEIRNKINENKKNISSGILMMLALFLIPVGISNANNALDGMNVALNGEIVVHDSLKPLVRNVNAILKGKECSYIYVDTIKEEGYMNYYRSKYYLSDYHNFINYNGYIIQFQSGNEKLMVDFLNNSDIDYVIVRDWGFLQSKGFAIDSTNGTVLKKKKGTFKKLEEFFIVVEEEK